VEYIYLTLTVETSIPTKTELLIALAQATQTNKKTAGVYSLLSVMQAAEHLGLTAWYVYQKIYSRQIAFHKIGGRIFIAQTDLDDYVARGRVAALGEKKAARK